MRFELIETGEADIEVMRSSEGPPDIVLLPGANGGIRAYQALCLAVAGHGFSVCGLNPRGCGASTGPLEGLTYRTLADDVAGVIAALCQGPVLLAGHAGGNRVARMLAARRPDLVSAVVLIAAGGEVPGEPEAIAAMRRAADASLPRDERLAALADAFVAPGNPLPECYRERGDRSNTFFRAFAAADRATPQEEWLGGGQSRMLVIQGRQDRIAPVANGHRLRERFPDRVEVFDIDNAGHALAFERPEDIARLIATFADGL